MKLEMFFEKFDQFADAPDAVAKMCELIMWFAFSGGFSTEERNQPMPEEWAIEGAPTLPAIPSSWKWQRGSEVFEVIRGVSYKKNDASDGPVEGSVPVLRANNIGNGINFDDLVYVPRDNIRDEQLVRRGDILIAMSSGSKRLVGKAAPIITDFIGAFGAFCGIIRNKSTIPDEVLALYFQSPQYTSWVTAAGRGIGINNLGRSDLDSLPVPTPPLFEQKRIVAKVDELMELCDQLGAQQGERETRQAALARASLARFDDAPTAANINFIFHKSYDIPPADLRKSIFTLAVQGKLVCQDPNDESASELIHKIKEAKRRLIIDKQIKPKDDLLEIKEEELDFQIPNGWEWARLGDICHRVSDGFHHSATKLSEGVLYISATHIFDGRIDWNSNLYVSESDYNDLYAKAKQGYGDILIVNRGAGCGDAAIVDTNERFCFQNAAIIGFDTSLILSTYMLLLLRASKSQFLEKFMRGGAQPMISNTLLNTHAVPIAPLAEQRRIVAKVDQLMALVDQLESQLATSRATAANLLEAIVAELTGTRSDRQVSASPTSGTGRRGRPPKSP
jgi:type I restriction enzyme S subunit